MPFLQFTLDIGARNPEPYEDALFALGALSVTLLDAADDPVLEPAPGAMPLWPTVVVNAVFPADADMVGVRTALGATPGLDPLLIAEKSKLEAVADRAWEREWLKDFRPMRFGRRLWVCPGGQRPPTSDDRPGHGSDDRRPAPTPVLLELDPGLAFGTGTHATTALCLEWLDSGASDWLTGAEMIDYGCGSGILAIAALKLGARHAVAMDIDPQALIATRENAARNGVADRLRASDDPDCGHSADVDVLVANILAGPLVDLAPRLSGLVRPGGRIALSGLLLEQAGAVTEAYRPWFDIDLTGTRDDWGLLTGLRRA
ncbi:MAG TPA: 50S ribosomal protein L11 methyltransferase [Steroidobacteraceae bacterium]|nr:50S ribosomal protein L11 methyltransferase [Steroidobacteraceae bacterium]